MGDAGVDELENSYFTLAKVKQHFDGDVVDLDDRVRGVFKFELADLDLEEFTLAIAVRNRVCIAGLFSFLCFGECQF